MKRLYRILYLLLVIPLWSACSDENSIDSSGDRIQLDALNVQIADRATGANVATRAISDYVVNTESDPTSNNASDNQRLTGQAPWKLDVVIYGNDGISYLPPTATWSYSVSSWVPSENLYLPSYFKPKVEATLYSKDKTSLVDSDQSTSDKLLLQDVLVQKEDPYIITPNHMLRIELRHKHSMLDFILKDVNYADISSVLVIANNITYTPFKANVGTTEYLVILPEGISNPQIQVKTKAGAKYIKTLNIASTQRNNCYCVTLTGVELALSSVVVVDWAYGTALSGQYTTPASYPTFRGIANATVTVVYDNGLSQDITFNERGETTVKPFGRTIIQIDDNVLTTPIILSEMYVDLTGYLN